MSECPNCKMHIGFLMEHLGRRVSCPHCRRLVVDPYRFAFPPSIDDYRPLVLGEMPIFGTYWAWCPIDDGRSCRMHIRLQKMGIQRTNIFRADDPFIAPLFIRQKLDFRSCRCNFSPTSIHKAAERGIREAITFLKTGAIPATPNWISAPETFRPFEPDNACELGGWAYKGRKQYYDQSLYVEHPGNPDTWQDDEE